MRGLYLTVAVLMVGALTGCTNQKIIAQKDSEIDARDQRIAELQQEIGRLEQQAGSDRDRADQLNADLQDAHTCV